MQTPSLPPQARSFRHVLPAVICVTAVFFINYTSRSIMGPLLVHMEAALGIDHVESTSFLLFFSFGFGAGGVASGFIATKIRPRFMVGGSAVGAGCMFFLLSQAASPGEVRLLLAAMGLACGQYLTAAMMTLSSVVRTQDWGRAIAVHELSPTISFIVAPIAAEIAVSYWGWQGAMTGMGCLALCGGIFFLVFGKGGREKACRPTVSGIASAFKQPAVLVFVWMFSLAAAAEFAPFSVLSLSLTTEQGMHSAEASRLLSASRLASPIAALLGGWAVVKIGAVGSVRIFLLAQAASLLAMALPVSLAGTPLTIIAMTVQATSAAFVFPALFTLFAQAVPHNLQPAILSLATPIASCFGSGAAPFLLGTCGEYVSFSLGYLVLGLMFLFSLPCLRFSGASAG